MDVEGWGEISWARGRKGGPRRSARILPIVVVPTQLTPTRLTRNSDSSAPPDRPSDGVRVRCRRHGGTADGQGSGWRRRGARAHAAPAASMSPTPHGEAGRPDHTVWPAAGVSPA